jgi:YD repeat-containing protein
MEFVLAVVLVCHWSHDGDGSAAARCGVRCEFPLSRECDDNGGAGGVRELFGGHGGEPDGDVDQGVASTAQYQAGTNYAAPGALTVNGLSNAMQWDAALRMTQNTGANGEVSGTVYDTYGRPSVSTAATGASTGYTYSTAAPWTVTATVNGRWTKKTLDGFGRVVKQESGHGGTTVSVTETEYDACACSATGKVKRVSMPRAPGGTGVWTNYTYDEMGRTTRVTNPDNTYKEYEYVANTVKVWDEARKWKKYTMDVFGNLVQVEEPKPAADTGHTGNYFTTYKYDVLGHLIEVSMPRGALRRSGSSTTNTRRIGPGRCC